jgi:hypothetical protein
MVGSSSTTRSRSPSPPWLAATPGLVRLVPSHGAIVSERAAEVLREVAARLR